jgi:hypothetical protein
MMFPSRALSADVRLDEGRISHAALSAEYRNTWPRRLAHFSSTPARFSAYSMASIAPISKCSSRPISSVTLEVSGLISPVNYQIKAAMTPTFARQRSIPLPAQSASIAVQDRSAPARVIVPRHLDYTSQLRAGPRRPFLQWGDKLFRDVVLGLLDRLARGLERR